MIAELGINHNGSLTICKQLIDAAVAAGCNAVKLQKRDIDTVYTQAFLDSPRESPWGNTQRDQKVGLEFDTREYLEIDAYCRASGVEWFVLPGTFKARFFFASLTANIIKLHLLLLHKPLLRRLPVKVGTPLFRRACFSK